MSLRSQRSGVKQSHIWRSLHAAMEVFLVLNSFQINAAVDEQKRVILQVASGELDLSIHCSTLSNAGNHTE
ncbi:MAG: hypothetical protein RMY29_025410 [Nostoc sp. CreGUA01]|nr:hypothetical protein [Nostoc sp. CreGUA01]